jgi:acetyl esterase
MQVKPFRQVSSAVESSPVRSLRRVVLFSFVIFVVVAFAGFSPGAGGHQERVLAQANPSSQQRKTETAPVASDPQVQAIFDQMAAAGVLHPKSLQQARAAYVEYSKFSGSPEKVFRVEDRKISGPAGEIPIRLYTPREGGGLPIWVFFHGGGFVAGSLGTHDTPLRAIANRCECLIVSVGYRLAPENPYPAAPNDAYAATKWVADHAIEIGGDPKRIAVGGDGAGGNLAAVVTLMIRDHIDLLSLQSNAAGKTALRAAAAPGPQLDYQVLIYPTVDLTMLTKSWILSHDPVFNTDSMALITGVYVPVSVDPEQGPYISPVQAKTLQGVPPAFILTDRDDPVSDEAKAYASNLENSHVPVEVSQFANAIHGFFLMAGQLDAGKKAIDEIGAHLKQAFASE